MPHCPRLTAALVVLFALGFVWGCGNTPPSTEDAGVGSDAGNSTDAGMDAGTNADAGGSTDGGSDSGTTVDAGAIDSGSLDSGSADAGFCGDGILNAGEQCDDGNRLDLDGCDSTCHYEMVTRMTTLAISGAVAPAFCSPTTNAFGTKAFTNTALGQLNPGLQTAVNNGSVNVMFRWVDLSDLTGVTANGAFALGITSGTLDARRGTWPGGNPEDWWFTADHADFAGGVSTNLLSSAVLSNRALTAGPSSISLPMLLGGSPVRFNLLGAKLTGAVNASPAPNVPAPPPTKLDAGVTVFQTATASATGQGLCGNITVESLALIPVPQSLTTGGTACAMCAGSHVYTYCGAGNPVGPTCNSLLDVFIGGCGVIPVTGNCVGAVLNPTQPDVPSGGTVKALSLGANNKVTQQTAGDTDSYSSFFTFDANRAHLTGESCILASDCQTGQTCTGGLCH